MKKVSVRSLKMLLMSGLCMMCCGCGTTSQKVDVDNVEIVELAESNSDIQIIPIKCDIPMDAILCGISYDDYVFLMGLMRTSIYCVQEDTVVSILNASGRGHGEYTSINDFAYSPDEKLLYVNADGKLLKYSVPEMEFQESVDLAVTPSTMIVMNPEEILMNCSFYEENQKDLYRGICLVSSRTGEVLNRCFDFDYINKKFLMPWDITVVPGGIVFPLNSLTRNSILFYDTESGSTENLFTFSFNSNWKVPRRLVKMSKEDPMLYAMEDYKETRHLEGGHFPNITDSGLEFWCFPREDNKARQVAVTVRDGDVTCRSFIISGTGVNPSPMFIRNGYYVDIVSPTDFVDSDADALSPLGLELKRTVDSQRFENPVFLYFKAD